MANKFTYDTTGKLFILNAGVTSLDLKTEFYSWVKSDWKTNAALTKFRFPINSIAGNGLGGGVTISPYYELLYGWKIRPQEANHTLTVVGNILTDDESDPFAGTLGVFNVRLKYVVSANSLSTGGSGVTAQDKLDIAAAVHDEALSGHTMAGTAGKAVLDTLAKTIDVHKLQGLETGSALTVSATQRSAGGITQSIGENAGVVTVTRQ